MEKKPGDLEGLAEKSEKILEKEAATTSKPTAVAPKSHEATTSGDIPDPDEDDLDDLDDMLDEFSPSKPESTPSKAPSGPGRPEPQAPIADFLPEGLSDEEFAKQFQAGMAELMGEIETTPDMQAQLETMLKELGGAAALGEAAGLGPTPVPSSSKDKETAKAGPSAGANPTEESFQETIKKTMERMQTSGDQATAAAASENSDDILAEMMKAMQSGALDGEGGEEEFSKMLLGMMEQLTNKEILYEPMKELDDKFPDWMEKNKGKVEAADWKRYQEQQIYVREIVKRFETKTYKDENAADREYIVERMQKMQAAGSPPPDLVGDMAAAQEAFGAAAAGPEEGCPTQ
ncbi:related to PEX19 protein [Phialocephala subalpina]|uniref:Related to PEX19 protein n=1 Tax=Phialocephala subalpina TaxID=576137 RepID=A0A1L7X3Q4_9HELO|nr:related to PEX19 protein [Phialocephala subalpina]